MKKKPTKNYVSSDETTHLVKENSASIYIPLKKTSPKQLITKEFLYSDFKKIADKAPFTIGEWADILHISERTLHRYAKDNSEFNGMQVERILHIEKLIKMGNELFGKEGFKNWLGFKPFSLQTHKPIEQLTSYQGIQDIIDLLGRMQHGIPA